MSAYLMVSLQFHGLDGKYDSKTEPLLERFQEHPCWQSSNCWTSRLHNLQLLIGPFIYFCLIQSWLSVFDIPQLKRGFSRLISVLNQFRGWQLNSHLSDGSYLSSA